MADYHVNYTWDASQPVPLLIATVSGRVLTDLSALPRIIDQAHALSEQHTECDALYLAYDLSRTERRLPLDALMQRTRVSPRVKAVFVIGVGSRKDEMAALIMSAAKRLPYPIDFFPTLDDLYAALHVQNALR